jgi:hypothetical protein
VELFELELLDGAIDIELSGALALDARELKFGRDHGHCLMFDLEGRSAGRLKFYMTILEERGQSGAHARHISHRPTGQMQAHAGACRTIFQKSVAGHWRSA